MFFQTNSVLHHCHMNEAKVGTKDSHYVVRASVFPFESDSPFNDSQHLQSVTETITETFLPDFYFYGDKLDTLSTIDRIQAVFPKITALARVEILHATAKLCKAKR